MIGCYGQLIAGLELQKNSILADQRARWKTPGSAPLDVDVLLTQQQAMVRRIHTKLSAIRRYRAEEENQGDSAS